MSISAFLLIFLSVFMHAAWNFLGKKDSPTMAFFWLAGVAGALFWLPGAFLAQVDFPALPGKFWLFFLISSCFEVLYMTALAFGYRNGDISLVYPLGRSLPVLLIAAVTALLGIGKTPGILALAGMVVIFAGCIIMPLQKWGDFRLKTYCSKVLFWVLLIGIGTTGYTICDSITMGILQELPGGRSPLFKSIFYTFCVQLGIGAFMLPPVLGCKKERQELCQIWKRYPVYVAGIFSASAYVLVLLAMKFVTNVSFVQAFRQMSLPIGILAGIFILKESSSAPKITGILLVIAGLIMTSL